MNLVRIAAGGLTTSARCVSIDGDEVADLGDAFDAACDLLNVEAWYVQGTRVLADPRPDAVLDLLLLLGDLAYVPPVPPTDERPGGGVGILPLGPSTVRVLRTLVLRRSGADISFRGRTGAPRGLQGSPRTPGLAALAGGATGV